MALRYKKYDKKYCEGLEKHMSQGLSYESYAAVIGVSRIALYEWEEKYPEWAISKAKGQDAALRFWETLLVTKAAGQRKEADITAIIFCLKTRFHKHYGENKRVELSGEVTSNHKRDLSRLSSEQLKNLESILENVATEESEDED